MKNKRLQELMEFIDKYDAFKVECELNRYGFQATVWNGYGLAISAEGESEMELLENLKAKVAEGNWR